MSELITNKEAHYEVTEELLWVKNQIQKELANLQHDVQEDQIKKSFYERAGDDINFDISLVKQYLASCLENENFQVNSAVVMAVQIALETIDIEKYYLGKIDGLLTRPSGKLSKTQKALRLFQKNNNIRVDGFPGKETIQKILDVLGKEKSPDISASTKTKEKDNSVPEEATIGTDKIETKKDIKVKLDKNGNVSNLQEILDVRNLELPKLKASDVSEIGGLGNSIMHEFQWYGKNTDKHFTHMIGTPELVSTTTHIMKFKSEEHVKQYAAKNPHIKSFVLYFGGNTSDNEQTLHDLANWAERLSNAGIEPVLCTCIGVEKHITQEEQFKSVNGKRLEPLNNNIRNIVNESKGKYKLIDFAKIDDVTETGSNNNPKSYALMHDIVYKCIEK